MNNLIVGENYKILHLCNVIHLCKLLQIHNPVSEYDKKYTFEDIRGTKIILNNKFATCNNIMFLNIEKQKYDDDLYN